MERLDNILKSVATAAVVQVSSNIKEEEAEAEVKPPQKAGARRPTLPGEIHTLLHSFASYCMIGEAEAEVGAEDSDKRILRRERNKQAAARCRKRRMDLTFSLQEEVDIWEEKVRSLKEELSELETQKRGLEAILRRHSTSCKVIKSE